MSDRALIERVGHFVAREREATAALVAHLAEVEARRLHLAEGYSSLFGYCTEALHLSEQAAYNRIEAARAARRFPRILGRLADGSVHLTAIRLLAPLLTEENHEALLEEVRHRSRREVALLRHQVPNGDVAAIFDLALQALIERVEERKLAKRKRPRTVKPERSGPGAESTERRRPRAETADRKRQRSERSERQAALGSAARQQVGPRSRYIPADVRRAVWERHGGRCAYVSPSGRRCTETGFLEFHHLEPHACGGPATVENIELRCRGHNGHEAEQRFGLEKMRARVPRLRAMATSPQDVRNRLHANEPCTCENECNSSRDELRMESQAQDGAG